MKGLIFRHYLKRALTEPVGIGIVTGLPTVFIVILSLVMRGQLPAGAPDMWNGYNVVNTHIAIMFMVSFQFFGGNILLDYIHSDFRGDRRWRLFSMPVKPDDYVFGVLAACFVYSVVQGGVVVGVTSVFLDVYWGSPWILIATLAACAGIAQLLYLLLFLLFSKKGAVEAFAQVLIWVMMFASGWIGFSADGSTGTAFQNFITQYGTPISLARNAITDSGFIGGDLPNALLSTGILYLLFAALAAVVALTGRRRGFSPGKNTIAASAGSTPGKGLTGARSRPAPTGREAAGIPKGRDLALTTPTARGGRLTIYQFALLRAGRSPLTLLLNGALPLILIFTPGLWRGEAAMGYSFIGAALMYGSFVAARGILNDRLDGTIIRIFASPVTSARYLTQNLLAAVTQLTLPILAVGILGHRLHGWAVSFTLSLMLLYFLFAAASVAFSFAWSCLFKEKETSYAVFSVLMSLVAMLGGFFVPLAALPDGLRYIGALFPAFWVSNGILCLRGGSAMGTFWSSAAAVVLFTVLYMVFGSKRRLI